jgi:diacylglycerol O-acyltransferase
MLEATEPFPAWGVSPEMNAVEALMWRGDADPRLRSTMTLIEVLDCVPEWDRLHAAHEWGSRVVPRFRQRVVEPWVGVGMPAWELDPGFDIDFHLRRRRLESGDQRELLDVAAEFAGGPFDRQRPPWEALLVDGLEGGRGAYILKLHHSITDGLGGVQLLNMLHSDRREPNPDKPQPPPPAPTHDGAAGRLRGASAPGQVARAVKGMAQLASRAGLHPRRTLTDSVHFAQSLERVLASPPAQPSPLLKARGLEWRFEALDVPLARLRAAGKAAGGSLNDAFIAALSGAFRRYHDAFGASIEAMPVAMPVSLRKQDDPQGGNRFAALRFAAPVGEADPGRRISLIRELVTTGRSEPALDALGLVAPFLGRLPTPVLSRLAGRLTEANDLQASNVPGISRPVYIAGAQITRMYPFGPLPGCAAKITLLSHNDRCCVGANLDAAAFADPALFSTCLTDGFEEVLSLG